MPPIYGVMGLVGLVASTAAACCMRGSEPSLLSRGVFGSNGFLTGVALATFSDAYTVVGYREGAMFSGPLLAAHLCIAAAAAAMSAVAAAALLRCWAAQDDGDAGESREDEDASSARDASGSGALASILQQHKAQHREARRRLRAVRLRLQSSRSGPAGAAVTVQSPSPGLPPLSLPFVAATLALLAGIAGVQSNGPLGSGAGGGAAVPGGISAGDVGARYFRLSSAIRPPWLPPASVVAAAVSDSPSATAAELAASSAASAALAADVWASGSGRVSAGGCFPSSLTGARLVAGGASEDCAGRVVLAVLRGLAQVGAGVRGAALRG